ncbi:MAG: ACP S-malonyltransferase [Trueperaceae bacterium]|nr:ACP S-malonyltransferase [Trueperaceae bacterium]
MIAALFPGQGSQLVGMAKDFYEHSPAAKAVLDKAETALPRLLRLMFDGPEDELKLTANQQPALVAASAAAFAAYKEAGGATPHYAAGNSIGEYSAHVAAGSLSITDAIRLVHKRGTYMQEAVPEGLGAMAAILKVDKELVAKVCAETEGIVEISNLNSPGQTVISGETDAVARAAEKLKEERARVTLLPVSAPFHCSLMQPAADNLAKDLEDIKFRQPAFGIVCNVTADLLEDISQAKRLLTEQVTAAVRWTETVEKLTSLGVTRYLEFGSGKVLTSLVGRILDKPDAKAVTDMASLREAL